MAYTMTPERIEKYPCSFCGSRSKKLVEIYGDGELLLGKSMVCCNCGHVDNFVETFEGIPVYTSMQRAGIRKVDINCALSETLQQRCLIEHCDCGCKVTEESVEELVQDKTYPECPPPTPHTPPEFEAKPKAKPLTAAGEIANIASRPAGTWVSPTPDAYVRPKPRVVAVEDTIKAVQANIMAEARPRAPHEMVDTHDEEVRVLRAMHSEEIKTLEDTADMKISTVRIGERYN